MNNLSAMSSAARAALEKLQAGNRRYCAARTNDADISESVRARSAREGQTPYAVVIACSDSRVCPEHIFSAGIGELFVIRVAGNVIDRHQLGSVEYATDHLGAPLVVVLGHSGCGAIHAAMCEETSGGYVASITDEIRSAIGAERDDLCACRKNVSHGVDKIIAALGDLTARGISVVGAIYDTARGTVEFL